MFLEGDELTLHRAESAAHAYGDCGAKSALKKTAVDLQKTRSYYMSSGVPAAGPRLCVKTRNYRG